MRNNQNTFVDLVTQLATGDRRTTGKSAQVTQTILKHPKLFDQVFDALWQSADAGVRMRAADVCETVSRTRPDLLQARKRDVFKQVAPIEQQEVRWHLCQMLPRLQLTRAERRRAYALMQASLAHKSGIVRTFAMQAMVDFAKQDATLLPETIAQIETLTATGTPAMRSRGKTLLRELKT